MLRRLSMGKNSASSSIRWAELPWASWPSRSRMAVRLSSMPFKAGSSQSYRPETSSIVVSVRGALRIQLMSQNPCRLSQHGNVECSAHFEKSIATMPLDGKLQGSCCAPMDEARYGQQIEG